MILLVDLQELVYFCTANQFYNLRNISKHSFKLLENISIHIK